MDREVDVASSEQVATMPSNHLIVTRIQYLRLVIWTYNILDLIFSSRTGMQENWKKTWRDGFLHILRYKGISSTNSGYQLTNNTTTIVYCIYIHTYVYVSTICKVIFGVTPKLIFSIR